MTELEKAFQLVNAYDGLCVPKNTTKESYLVSLITKDEPYKTVVMQTAERLHEEILVYPIEANKIRDFNNGIMTHSEAIFLQVHCKCSTIGELIKFITKTK